MDDWFEGERRIRMRRDDSEIKDLKRSLGYPKDSLDVLEEKVKSLESTLKTLVKIEGIKAKREALDAKIKIQGPTNKVKNEKSTVL